MCEVVIHKIINSSILNSNIIYTVVVMGIYSASRCIPHRGKREREWSVKTILVSHFRSNSRGIAYRVTELNASLCLVTRAKKKTQLPTDVLFTTQNVNNKFYLQMLIIFLFLFSFYFFWKTKVK